MTSYGYDERDRLLTKSTPEGRLTYTYDLAGNRKTAQSDSRAYDVGYGYDALNRLATVTDRVVGGGTTTYRYDDGGRLGSYDYPNGVSSGFGYDALNRVQSMKIGTGLGTPSEQLVAGYGYTFYPTGNRHTVTELSGSGRGVTWAYDNLWRLANETIGGSSVSGSISYGYDNAGNRLSRTSSVSGIPSQSSSYDSDDRLLADGWDANGNTLTSGSNQYGYDSENRLLSLNTSQARYSYDGDGQLVSKTASGVATTYLVDDQTAAGYTQIVEERVSGTVQKTYVFGPQRISLRDSAGLHYYAYDAHSGVRLLMDGSGVLTDTWDYDAFGNVIARTGTTLNEFTYRGEQTETGSGFEYLRARWLDRTAGRFASRDAPFMTEHPLHPYAYAAQDPVERTDPTGRFDVSGGLADFSVPNIALNQNWLHDTMGSTLPGNLPEQPPDLHSTSLSTNFNSAELFTPGVYADEVFSRYITTFAGVKRGGVNDVVVNGSSLASVTGMGDILTFSFPGAISNFGQPPFSVEVKRFNPSLHTVSVVTLRGHPIAGYRYWRVREIDRPDHLMVETGAVDEPGPTPSNSLMFHLMKGVQLEIWQNNLEYIAKDMGAAIGPRSIVEGTWQWSQPYVLRAWAAGGPPP